MTLGLLWNRILFEEACTTAIAAVQHMPQLRVLHLEPTAEDSLVPEDLFTLGKHLQELCVLGECFLSASSVAAHISQAMEQPAWSVR